MKRSIAYIVLIVFVLLFLHSELDCLKVEGDNCIGHDICQLLENSATPSPKTQISVIQIITTFHNSQFTIHNSQFTINFHRNDFIYNPLSQFFEGDLIYLFNTLLI